MVTVEKIVKQYKRFEEAQKLKSEQLGQGNQSAQGLSVETRVSVEPTQAEKLTMRRTALTAADIIINPFIYSRDKQDNGAMMVDQANYPGMPDEKR